MNRNLADVQVCMAILDRRLDRFADRQEGIEQRSGLVDV